MRFGFRESPTNGSPCFSPSRRAAAGGAAVRADRRHRRPHHRRGRRQRSSTSALFGQRERNAEGPRLSDLDVMASTEGAPIPRVYGRARLAGQVIWATNLEEVIGDQRRPKSGGGKGGGATDHHDDLFLFRQFRGRLKRRRDRRRRAHLGRRQAA